ncbi:MAG TPA: DoxX family protein [Melioribacteraceae bacterium]|nr:DoxX family protein [Melioribacteraceae bacterium]
MRFPVKNIKSKYAILLIRIMVGSVFVSEGIQKFLYPDQLGAGRFLKIGLPLPEFFGLFVPAIEILCGLFLLIGLYTRYAAVPLLIIMIVAIISTKIPILINDGFWKMAHDSRTDWSMLIGSIFIILADKGKLPLHKFIIKKVRKVDE